MTSTRRRIPFWVFGLIAFAIPAAVTVVIRTSEVTLHSAGSGAYTSGVTVQAGNLILIVGLAVSVVLGVGVGAVVWAARRRSSP